MKTEANICRICARPEKTTINVDQIEKLRERISKYLNIMVNVEDPLPKAICIKCFRMVNLFHEFVLMSRESQKILRADVKQQPQVQKQQKIEQTDNIPLEIDQEDIDFPSCHSEDEEQKGFDCEHCWFHCNSLEELSSHEKSHTEDTKYVAPPRELSNFICDKCPTEMCNWEQYKRHFWYNHTYSVIKCSYPECHELIFQNRAKLRKHNQMKHCNEKPTCYLCGKNYASKVSLITHIRSVHQNCRNNKCNICGKSFQTSYNLKTHMKSHTRIAQFSCPECSRPFVYKHLMKKHLLKFHTI